MNSTVKRRVFNPNSTIERICGVLLIALPVVAFIFLMTDSQFNTYDKSFQESIRQVVDSPSLFRADMAFLFVSGLVSIALAAAMYLAFRSHERTLALLGAFWLLGLGTTMVVGTLGGVALAHMADQFETSTPVHVSMIATSARPFQVIHEESALLGMTTFFPLSLLTFGAIIAWSRAVPRWLGWPALVIGVVILLGWVGPLFLKDIGMIFGFLWSVLLGGWMIVRGTREALSAPYVGLTPHAEPTPAAGDA